MSNTETVQLEKSDVLELYAEASESKKKILEKKYLYLNVLLDGKVYKAKSGADSKKLTSIYLNPKPLIKKDGQKIYTFKKLDTGRYRRNLQSSN